MDKPYIQYAKDVIDGKIVSCENIKLACRRFLNDMQREDLDFREDVVDRAIEFIGILKHFTSDASGKPFILEAW